MPRRASSAALAGPQPSRTTATIDTVRSAIPAASRARIRSEKKSVATTTEKQAVSQERMETAYARALESFENQLKTGLVESLSACDVVLGVFGQTGIFHPFDVGMLL